LEAVVLVDHQILPTTEVAVEAEVRLSRFLNFQWHQLLLSRWGQVVCLPIWQPKEVRLAVKPPSVQMSLLEVVVVLDMQRLQQHPGQVVVEQRFGPLHQTSRPE